MTRRIGIDLAVRGPHVAAVFEDGRGLGRPFIVEAGKASFDELFRRAQEGAVGPLEVVMEPTGPVWLMVAAECVRRGCRVFVPNGRLSHRVREIVSPKVKSDGRDASALAMLPHMMPDHVHEWRRPNAKITALRQCLSSRAAYVAESCKYKTRIRDRVHLSNPILANTAGWDPFTAVGATLLKGYLDPFRVRQHGESRFRRFWTKHAHGPNQDGPCLAVWNACLQSAELFDAMREAEHLPIDYDVLQLLMRSDYQCLEALEEHIGELDQRIAVLYGEVDPQRTLEREVPGVAATIAPAIEAYVGDVGRFPNVKSFVSAFGIVPGTRQSGGNKPETPGTRITKAGPALLRKYLYLAAETARRCDPVLADCYKKAVDSGKHHTCAVIIVAHKLLRKIYAVLRQRDCARKQPLAPGTSPAAHYEYRTPEAQPIDKRAARAMIADRFPSKSAQSAAKVAASATSAAPTAGGAKRREEAAEAAPSNAGSPEGATKMNTGTPPTPRVPREPTSEKAHSSRAKTMMSYGELLDRLRSQQELDTP